MGPVMEHGGSLAWAQRIFPHVSEPWVDLSTGINPHSYPLCDLPSTVFARLPEPHRIRELAKVAAAAYGAPDDAHVVPAPGTQILLPRVAALVPPGRALVLGPTYAEHRLAAGLAGHKVEESAEFERLFEADLAIIVNPNNPDGRIIERSRLVKLAQALKSRGGLLVLDEAFMDVGPVVESLAGDVASGGIVVLRSFGKFFGLAGVRLGFAIANTEHAEKLRAELGPWAVAGPALEIGLKALADWAWQDAMRSQLADEAARIDRLFAQYGLAVSGGTSLFRFVRMTGARALFDAAGQRGVLLRAFTDQPDALRVGLPGSAEGMVRLEAALRDWSALREAGR